MWLLKIHIALSILCLITFVGFANVFKEQIKQNGWLSEKKKKRLVLWLLFFVPIMNVLFVLLLFLMIGMKEEEFEKLKDYVEKESEENK